MSVLEGCRGRGKPQGLLAFFLYFFSVEQGPGKEAVFWPDLDTGIQLTENAVYQDLGASQTASPDNRGNHGMAIRSARKCRKIIVAGRR